MLLQPERIGLCFCLLAAAGAAACAKKEAPAPPPPVVEVAPVVQKDVPVYAEWIGTLDGFVNAEIRPQVGGYLLRRDYKEGSFVRKGDLLFEIDPRQFQATFDQARGNVARWQAELANAKMTAARYRPLAVQKAISQQELDDAVTREQTAQANLETSQASLEKAKLDLGWTKVVSPIDGITGVAKAQVGDLLTPQTVLTSVSTLDPIKVNYNPSEQEYLAFVQKVGPVDKLIAAAGTPKGEGPLQLILSDGSVYPHRGRGYLVGREVDPKTGTIAMAGLFPNPGNVLRPGQYAKVRTTMELQKGALLVPQRAVSELQGSYQVAVVGADNKVTIKVVKPGPREGSLWVIEEGLKPGDRIVVEGLQRVRSGMTVVPKEASKEAPTGASAPAAPTAAKEGGK
ncbi:MAG: efflux RND transporter periplasmic adaptor subunit [Acidithiobacillales bacterium]